MPRAPVAEVGKPTWTPRVLGNSLGPKCDYVPPEFIDALVDHEHRRPSGISGTGGA
ncbi:MAG TPA: hypothetical protein VME46_05780 [Acidimicrobiales bacterium]|nr:hypothetical protein [Acidimicrobiales bacterium]